MRTLALTLTLTLTLTLPKVSKWAHQNSREYRQRQVDLEEMQAPTTVVNKLIRMTQSPSAARRARDAREAR